MNATPDKQKMSRLAYYRQLEEAGQNPLFLHLPEIDHIGEHIFAYLLELGPMRDSGMGHTSVSWQEIKAWSDMTLAKLDAWEASLIKRLSDEYTYQFNISSDPTCGPPYQDFSIETIPQAVHESIDQKLRKVFAKLKAKTE